MRLICPNCGAQYEVPDEVVPETGRDVQCSNCGHTWFQHHPNSPPAEEDIPEAQDWQSPEEDLSPEPEPEPEPQSDHDPDPESETEAEIEPDVPTAQRREIDPDLGEMLREEAERETQARAAEQGGLETQPDLGLDPPVDESEQRTREARSRMAKIRGLPEESETATEDELMPGSRRNLLPDIEEINSSLNSDGAHGDMSSSAADSAESMMPRRKKGGFRRGFLLMVILAVIGTVIYVFAPQIAAKVPALEGALSSYVEAVNGGRIWLNERIGGLLGSSN